MSTLTLTFAILLTCLLLMAIGLILAGKPLQKRCSSDPDEECSCKKDDCERA